MRFIDFRSKTDLMGYNFDNVMVDVFWNRSSVKEASMHCIHNYPAKFPAFIVDKAIAYAMPYFNGSIKRISDIFCGCGTVALESRIHGIDFWGCDINPVATLIARTKSDIYCIKTLKKIEKQLYRDIEESLSTQIKYSNANERIRYWYYEEQYKKLFIIKSAIDRLPNSKYKRAFYCIFSSILKSTSKWLTKSIKPQIDPQKKPTDPIVIYKNAVQKFIKIVSAEEKNINKTVVKIENCNFLNKRVFPVVDLIVTSPPYVTSYEYADLHQLSSLWLGFTDDYTELRKGTIGSVYNIENYYFDLMDLNDTANNVVKSLYKTKTIGNSKTKSVARYYADMQLASKNCYKMLSENGIACFVIGDTKYKGVKIENAKHLVESLLNAGFKCVRVAKRKISNKTLSPYRDASGRFSSDENNRKVYNEEFVVIAHKKEL